MKRWQYMMLELGHNDDITRMCKLGELQWELVNVVATQHCRYAYFKRKIL